MGSRRPLGRIRSLRSVVVISAIVLPLAACGGGTTDETNVPGNEPNGGNEVTGGATTLDQLVEAAQAEGELVVYTGDAEDVIKLEAQAFEAKYGIKVNYVRALTDPLNARITSEYETGVNAADFLQGGSISFAEGQSDYFMKLDESVLPDWESYPEVGRRDHYAFLRENPSVIHYNTDLVPEDKIPKDWPDLLDPFWKGHLLLTDPLSSESYLGWGQVMVEKYGVEYLEKLRDQDFEVAASGAVAAQQIAAGTAYASFPARLVHSVALREQGAPIAYNVIGGPTGSPIPGAVFAKAPHPNAALLFLHYLLSPEGNEEMCANFETVSFYNIDGKSPDQAIDGCLEAPSDWELADHIPTEEQRAVILEALGL